MYIAVDTVLNVADTLVSADLPHEIDLGAPHARFQLAELDTAFADLSPLMRDSFLARLRLDVPAPETTHQGFVVLPGGALALHCGVEGIMVCDPQASTVLGHVPSERLRKRLSKAPGIFTITHQAEGLAQHSSIPVSLPRQACSFVPDTDILIDFLPIARQWAGRALVQWNANGAVVWPLVTAPEGIALLACVAATPLTATNAPLHAPLSPAVWATCDDDDRMDLITPGLFEHVNDLLIDEVQDDVRYALAQRAIQGEDNTAQRLAQAVRGIPASFYPDFEADAAIGLLDSHPRAAAMLHASELVVLMVEGTSGTVGLNALRKILDNEGLFFGPQDTTPTALAGRQAARVAKKLNADDGFGVLIAPPASPTMLYTLAHTVAERTQGRVTAAAPGWGLRHSIDARLDMEVGNAAWFGMGAGLDELEWL